MFCCIRKEKEKTSKTSQEKISDLKDEIRQGLDEIRNDPKESYWTEISFIEKKTEAIRQELVGKLKARIKVRFVDAKKNEAKEDAIARLQRIVVSEYDREMNKRHSKELPNVTKRLIFNEVWRTLKTKLEQKYIIRERFKSIKLPAK